MSDENAGIPSEEKSPMVELTGLWSHQGQNNEKFLCGSIGGATVFVFKNKYKEKDKQPDYRLCVARNRRKDEPGEFIEDAQDPHSEAPGVDDSNMPF